MFSVDDRQALASLLVEHATEDPHVTGAAFVGSAARGEQDEWSDIGLALCIAPAVEVATAADQWTEWFKNHAPIADTLDIHGGGGLYRVFLLENSLQVDLSFFPPEQFRATGSDPMQTVYGDPPPQDAATDAPWDPSARMGWLYLLHARSALCRGRYWQCELMLSELRGVILSLCAQRHGLRRDHARQAHLLPSDFTSALGASRASNVDAAELRRSVSATAGLYLSEISRWDSDYESRLSPAVDTIIESCQHRSPVVAPVSTVDVADDVVVRPATHEDREAVERLVDEFRDTGARVQTDALKREYTRVTSEPTERLLVAEGTGGHVVGYALAGRHTSFIAAKPVTWVEELYIVADHRGRGVGRELMGAIDEWADAIGASHIGLATRKAGEFYEQLDYAASATYYKRYLREQEHPG